MITVTILTKNSSKYIQEVLESVRHFDEVILYDTGSTDNTLDLASQYPNVVIHHGPFIGFGPTHNQASARAKNEWVLSIDSDEIVSTEMAAEVLSLDLSPHTVYSFPRNNYFNGKFIRWCGWYPDRVVRLYNRNRTRFSDAQVHEEVLCEGMKVRKVNSPLIHYSYSSHADFLEKMQSYSDLFANQYAGKKESSLAKAITHGFFAFLKSYLFKRGFLGGYEGFTISAYNGNTAFYKYLKLYEANCVLNSNKQQMI